VDWERDVGQQEQRFGLRKINWRRFAIVVPAIAVAGTLVGLTAKGALASSISVSGQEFTITANQLAGTGFAQYGSQLPNSKGGQTPVIVSTTLTLTNVTADQTVILAGQAQKTTVGVTVSG
jgi:hypothetical protein